MKNSFLSREEIEEIGFKNIGSNVQISKKISVYNPSEVSIGDNTRIDDFCVLSGNIKIGKNVHVAAGVYLFGGDEGIIIGDYVGISSRCSIYALTDDYSGNYLTNPTIDDKYKNVIKKQVIFKKHSIVGSGSVILPGSILEEGVAIGSMCLVNGPTDPWSIYVGIPYRKLKERSKRILELEKELENEQ